VACGSLAWRMSRQNLQAEAEMELLPAVKPESSCCSSSSLTFSLPPPTANSDCTRIAEATMSLLVKAGGGKPPCLSTAYSGGILAMLAPLKVAM
jgi:hypothetical protein